MSSNLDSILDSNIGDLADLPELQVYPNGTHKVVVKFEKKEINGNPAVEMKMKCVETLELANPAADTPLNPGTESGVLYILSNEFGQGKFKAIIKQFAANLGTSTILETMEAANGMEVVVVCKVRKNKAGTESYTDVTKVII